MVAVWTGVDVMTRVLAFDADVTGRKRRFVSGRRWSGHIRIGFATFVLVDRDIVLDVVYFSTAVLFEMTDAVTVSACCRGRWLLGECLE